MASNASPRLPLKRALVTTLKVGLYGLVIGVVALIVAVAVAMNQLPNFDELKSRANLGQTVHVYAADGSEVGRIDVPERPLQLVFGGAKGRTLFILAHHALFAVEI